MCIKVHEDEALQQKNCVRVDKPAPMADLPWKSTVEWARASVGASAAIFCPAPGQALIRCGELRDSALVLSEAVASAVRPEGHGEAGLVRLQLSWGLRACRDVVKLTNRFKLGSLALLCWRVGGAPAQWLALVNLAGHAAQHVVCARLQAIAESMRERSALQQQLREATLTTQRLQDVARASGDWVWETDEQHRYTWVHGAAPVMPAHAFWPPKVGEQIPSGLVVNWVGEPELPLQDFHAVLRQGEAFVRLVTKEQAHGHARYVSRSAVPLFHDDGRLRGYRGSARDVTQSLEAKAQLWRRERALHLAKERAEASSQAKSVLVSKVGHELRTPLNAIVGLAQLIQTRNGPGDNATVERWVAQIAKTGWHMVDVLDMLMDLGRTGAVAASMASASVELVDVVRDALHIVEREAHARSITITFEGHAPVAAIGHRRAICQVVVNLLSNAVKYNREGGAIRLRVAADQQARIEVQDTGPGLTEDQLGRLCRPFERLGAESTQVAGHGLGLMICKELVMSMHGELLVHSKVGLGTTFTVVLPRTGDVTMNVSHDTSP